MDASTPGGEGSPPELAVESAGWDGGGERGCGTWGMMSLSTASWKRRACGSSRVSMKKGFRSTRSASASAAAPVPFSVVTSSCPCNGSTLSGGGSLYRSLSRASQGLLLDAPFAGVVADTAIYLRERCRWAGRVTPPRIAAAPTLIQAPAMTEPFKRCDTETKQ